MRVPDAIRTWLGRDREDALDLAFDRYLDTGRPETADKGDDLRSLDSTVRQVIALDRQAFHQALDRYPIDRDAIRRKVMLAIPPTRPVTRTSPAKSPSRLLAFPNLFGRMTGSPVVNIVLIVAILGSLAYGLVTTIDRSPGEGRNGSHQAAIASTTPAETTPVIPSPEACTIDPLSVGDVMSRIENPPSGTWIEGVTLSQPASPTVAIEEQPISEPDWIARVAETQVEFNACLRSGQYMRAWALIDPGSPYWTSTILANFGAFPDRSMVMEQIGDVARGDVPEHGPNVIVLPAAGSNPAYLPAVIPDPSEAHIIDGYTVRPGMMYQALSPIFQSVEIDATRGQAPTPPEWEYRWDEHAGRWLIYTIGNGPNGG